MNIYRPFISALFALFMLSTFDSNAQQPREMYPLEVHDFECLRSLDCVQNSQSLKSKGWSFIFDETVDDFAKELTAQMKGENIYLYAIYDKEGKLIKSTYKRKDAALPKCLLTHHTEDNYNGWRITGSEMVVRDFDPSTIKYKVMLESETSARSEIYDFDLISDLHSSYEGMAELCLL